LTFGRDAINSMLCSAQSGPELQMEAAAVVILVVAVGSVYWAGRAAVKRGRSFKHWAWAAAVIGPLAVVLVRLLPDLRGKGHSHA
jgi:hypothetical protein